MISGASGSSLSSGSHFVTRQPISIFRQTIETKDEKEREELNKLLGKLRKSLPDGFKIGAAVEAGDCFFDSVAQGLNELKNKSSIIIGERFNVKSLRESCQQYAKQSKSSSWLSKDLKKGKDSIQKYASRIGFTVKDVKDSSSNSVIRKLELEDAICGRNEIEGKIICEKYNVKIKVIGLYEEESTTGEGDNVVYIVNYGEHFVPPLRTC